MYRYLTMRTVAVAIVLLILSGHEGMAPAQYVPTLPKAYEPYVNYYYQRDSMYTNASPRAAPFVGTVLSSQPGSRYGSYYSRYYGPPTSPPGKFLGTSSGSLPTARPNPSPPASKQRNGYYNHWYGGRSDLGLGP